MKYHLYVILVFLSFFSINAQEIQNDSLFTDQQRIRLLELGLQNIDKYSFDKSNINEHLKDALVFEKKRRVNNTFGYIILGVGNLTTIFGQAIVLETNNKSTSSGDFIVNGVGDSINDGVNQLGRIVRTLGFVVSTGSIPFFIISESKRNKRNQRIREAKKFF